MERLISNWILPNWQRKAIALICALLVWMFVSHSISETKTVIGIPVRVVNMPPGKTIIGLLPNGMLTRRLTVTLSGTRNVIKPLLPGDIEIILDAADAPNEWIVNLSKKNILSLNPDIDLQNAITHVYHQEFVINFTKLVTETIPVSIQQPKGKPPKGYQFLAVWPQHLSHKVTGPQEQVDLLKAKGMTLQFNLSKISKDELDDISSNQQGYYEDEIPFPVPDDWKNLSIPFNNHSLQIESDPLISNLEIIFLRKQYIPLNRAIPIRVFYPLEFSTDINPETHPLARNEIVGEKNGITILKENFLTYEVSRLFLDTVRDYIEVSVVAAPRGTLKWGLSFLEPQLLEDRYVTFLRNRYNKSSTGSSLNYKKLEGQWRQRFRGYMHAMMLYRAKNDRLKLHNAVTEDQIVVEER